MKLSIIIPVFNEESTIDEIIKRIENVPLSVDKEVIVVNDASTDNTPGILNKLKGHSALILLEH